MYIKDFFKDKKDICNVLFTEISFSTIEFTNDENFYFLRIVIL